MPVDEHGNRADIVMDSGSTISRMNLGRLYEHYIGAACRDTAKNIVSMLGIQTTKENEIKQQLNSTPKELIEKAYQYLLGFYQITSPQQFEFFSTRLSDAEKIEHLGGIVKNGIYLYMPPDNSPESVEIIRQLEQHYRPVLGPVRYTGNSGEVKVTKYPVRIAPLYMMLLEKIADDWASVSSGKLQHFGVLSPMTKSEKYSYPYRNSPVRTIGETEGRIFTSYCGREAMAEMMDRNNNTITHKNVVWNILSAPQPGNIGQVVDRSVVPFGGSKPLQLVNHISTCGGWVMAYEPEE